MLNTQHPKQIVLEASEVFLILDVLARITGSLDGLAYALENFNIETIPEHLPTTLRTYSELPHVAKNLLLEKFPNETG